MASSGRRNHLGEASLSFVPTSSLGNSPSLSPMLPANNGFVTVDGERWSDGSEFSLGSLSSATPSILSFGSSMPHTAPHSPLHSSGNAPSRPTLLVERDVQLQTLPADPDHTFSLLRFLTRVSPGTRDTSPEAPIQQQSEVPEPELVASTPASLARSRKSSPNVSVEQLTADIMAFSIQEQPSRSLSNPTLMPFDHSDALVSATRVAAQFPFEPSGEVVPSSTSASGDPCWSSSSAQDLYQSRLFRGPIIPTFNPHTHNVQSPFGMSKPHNLSATPHPLPVTSSPSISHSTALTDAEVETGPDVDSETDITSVASTVVPFVEKTAATMAVPFFRSPLTRYPTNVPQQSFCFSPNSFPAWQDYKYDEEDSEVILPVGSQANMYQFTSSANADTKQVPAEETQPDSPNLVPFKSLQAPSNAHADTSQPSTNVNEATQYPVSPPESKGICSLFATPTPESLHPAPSPPKEYAQSQERIVSPAANKEPYLSRTVRERKSVGRRWRGYGVYTDGSDSDFDAEVGINAQDGYEAEPELVASKCKEKEAIHIYQPPSVKPKESERQPNFLETEARSSFSEGQRQLTNDKAIPPTWDRWVHSPAQGDNTVQQHAPYLSSPSPVPWIPNQPSTNAVSKFDLPSTCSPYMYVYPGQAIDEATPQTPFPPIPPGPPSATGATRGSNPTTPDMVSFLPPPVRENARLGRPTIRVPSPYSTTNSSRSTTRTPPRARARAGVFRPPISSTCTRSPSPVPVVSFKLPEQGEDHWARSMPTRSRPLERKQSDEREDKGFHSNVMYPQYPLNSGGLSTVNLNHCMSSGQEPGRHSPWNDFSRLPGTDSYRPKPYEVPEATPNPRSLPSIPTRGVNNGASFTRSNSFGNAAPLRDSRRRNNAPPPNAAPLAIPNYNNTNPNWNSTPAQHTPGWGPLPTAWTSPWSSGQAYGAPGYHVSHMPPPLMMGTSTLPPSTSSLPSTVANLPFQCTGATAPPSLLQYNPYNPNFHSQIIPPQGVPPQHQPFTAPPSAPQAGGAWGGWTGGLGPSLSHGVYPVHQRFCFPDANVSLLVQNTEYRVHRYFLEKHSTYLKELLAPYPLHNTEPIPLVGVPSTDFDRLLSLFYPSDFSEPELDTVEEWTSILSLSSLWSLKGLRKRAIKELTNKTTAVQRILLARQHSVKEWALSGYEELCMRNKPVSLEEGEQLGLRTVLKVWEAQREMAQKGFCRMNCCKETMEEIIKTKFELI